MDQQSRCYERDGAVYLIRDVGPRMGCEYAVRGDDDVVEWKPCAEGVAFTDIEPLVIVNGR